MESVKEVTEKVKETAEINDSFFVEKSTPITAMLAADKAKKKLIFDIVDFPELPKETLGKLSKDARMAYQMDLRYSNKAAERMAEGESPYSETRDKIIAEDPLRIHGAGGAFEIEGKREDVHYFFPDPKDVERFQRAGYSLVKPEDPETVVNGVKKGDRIVITGDAGKVEHVAMKVDKKSYGKHRDAVVKVGQARLGQTVEETKERMRQYAPKVNIYDKTTLPKD